MIHHGSVGSVCNFCMGSVVGILLLEPNGMHVINSQGSQITVLHAYVCSH